jgi:hypothetical protein
MNKPCLWLIALLVADFLVGARAWAYTPEIHQQLTFIAARQFNRCMQDSTQHERLSALDTRYIVKSNVAQADNNMFVRMFRWNYYNREDQSSRSAWWLVETRFHEHFAELVEQLDTSEPKRQHLQTLGRLLTYIQKVSSPAHAVPVFTGRWWRFSMSDRFNRFPVDAEAVEQAVTSACGELAIADDSFQRVLIDAAEETLAAVQSPIAGFPATWESYWKLAAAADEFGEYGRAGNSFGERTEFRCNGERCLLLNDDPLYAEFALQRHVAAVIASMRAIALMERAPRPPDPEVNVVQGEAGPNP